MLAGLQYVRRIDGQPAHALILDPGSPLVTVMLATVEYASPSSGPGEPIEEPLEAYYFLQAGQHLSISGSGKRHLTEIYLIVDVYSLGGPIRSVSHKDYGSVATSVRQAPSNALSQRLLLAVNVRGPTCMLSDTTLSLDPVSADQLVGAGSGAGATPFDVAMNCPFSNTLVKLR